MSAWWPRSVRSRTTLVASLATVLVLAAASVLIVVLVERDLQSNARVALESALETASHAASGEESARGEENEQSESSGHIEGNRAAESSGLSSAVPDSEPSSDARIPSEDRVRVLDRFVRLDESRQRRTGSSGLGLSLSHAIAKRHRGSIDVGDSEHLGGARVTIELPLPDTEPADPTATIT